MDSDLMTIGELRRKYGEKLDQDFFPEVDSETFEAMMPRYFGVDPVDTRHSIDHP